MYKFYQRMRGRLLREESGQVMVEFAVIFPLQLLITLLIIQVTLIMVGKQVVNYAAFSAARAELVEQDGEAAAATVCIPISGSVAEDVSEDEVYLNSWNDGTPNFENLARRSRTKVHLTIEEGARDGTGKVAVRLNYDFEMSLPFVNWVIFYALDTLSPGLVHIEGMSRTSGPAPAEELALVIADVPHIVLKEKATLAMPWNEDESSLKPHEFIAEFDEEEEP